MEGLALLKKIKGVHKSSEVVLSLPRGFVALRPLLALAATGFDVATQALDYRAGGSASPGRRDKGDEAELRGPLLLDKSRTGLLAIDVTYLVAFAINSKS